MRLFEASLALYRKTLKRFRPLHIAIHWTATHIVIPLLERSQRFQTIKDDPFWFRLELLTGRHENETTRHLERLLKPGMTVLDIGAHVGYYTRRSARLVGPEGRVIAFEPHPRTFSVLEGNVSRLPGVSAEQLAVAEEEGTAELFDYLMMSASGSLHYDEQMRDLQKAQLSQSDIAPRISSDFPVQQYSVRTVPIDDFLAMHEIGRVDLVKMDIEGAEMGALRGMKTTIQNSPGMALIMEYNPQALTAFDFDPLAAMQEVLAMGFNQMQAIEEDGSLTDLTHDPAALEARTARLMENMGVVNMLFTRD